MSFAKRKNRVFLTVFLLLFSTLYTLNAQNSSSSQLHGTPLSDAIFLALNEAGFAPQKSELSPSSREIFPYNVIVDFSGNTQEKDGCTRVILDFTQDEALPRLNSIIELLTFCKSLPKDYDITVLFASGDLQNIKGNESMTGTEVFSDGLEGSENTCVLTIDYLSSKINSIIPGGSKTVSPKWLIQKLSETFEEKNIPYDIKGGFFLSLYNLGFLRTNERLSSFLKREIPSAGISLLNEQSVNEILFPFLRNYQVSNTVNYSKHYVPIKFFGKTLFMGEGLLIILLFSLGAISLFILCDFSFFFMNFAPAKGKEALKSIYFIPCTIIISTLAFYLGEVIAKALLGKTMSSPFLAFGIKIIIGIILLSFYFLFDLKRHPKTPIFVYEYLLTLTSVLNIFIFSAIDISFFLLFAIEYILLYLSRPAKRAWSLFVFLAIISIPYVPLIYLFILYTDMQTLSQVIFCNWGNILLSFAFIPFSIMWMRILAGLHRLAILKESKIPYGPFMAASLSLIFELCLILFVCNFVFGKFFYKSIEPIKAQPKIVKSLDDKSLKINYFETNYYGGETRNIDITTTKNAERISVTVFGETNNPIYHTHSKYEQGSTPQSAVFLMPDWPPNNIRISYTPDTSEISTIRISAYFPEGNHYVMETETITIDKQQGNYELQ